MPERRKQNKSFKTKVPSTYVHPSLRSPGSSTASASENSPRSVSERIEYLRRTQKSTQNQPEAQGEQSRPSLPIRPLRKVAGPAPPRSWTAGAASGRTTLAWQTKDDSTKHRRPASLAYFPGVKLPHGLSLMHQVLKRLAAEFGDHVVYDHEYLSTLPVYIKEVLLTYIAVYGSKESNVTLQGLRVLFASPDKTGLPDSTGTEGLMSLDVGGSIGRGLTLKDLSHYMVKRKDERKILVENHESPPDSWEDEDVQILKTMNSPLRFPLLTHLSLANPGPNVSWVDLLSFSRNHLRAITHLSLASWPTPTLPKADAEALTTNEHRRTQADQSYLDPSIIILQLSRHTPALQYLSLDGCQDWWYHLQHARTDLSILSAATHSSTQRSQRRNRTLIDDAFHDATTSGTHSPSQSKQYHLHPWTSSWQHLSHISMKQDWIPPAPLVSPARLYDLYRERTIKDHEYTASIHARGGEAYNLLSSSHAVRAQVEQRIRAREWCEADLTASLLAHTIRRSRRAFNHETSSCGRVISTNLEIDHGWDKDVLIEQCGYDEAELFNAGF